MSFESPEYTDAFLSKLDPNVLQILKTPDAEMTEITFTDARYKAQSLRSRPIHNDALLQDALMDRDPDAMRELTLLFNRMAVQRVVDPTINPEYRV